jgi:hypothetical protein
MTASFETDGIPTSCHVLIVENNGNLLRQIKVRQSRDYSAEHMLKKACQVIENQAKEILDGPKKNENQFGELNFGLEYEDLVDGMFVVYSELPHSNYANSLKRIWKTESGWKEQTFAVEWKGEYQESDDVWWHCEHEWMLDVKNYAPVDYDGKTPPVEFMNKVLPLTIKGKYDA